MKKFLRIFMAMCVFSLMAAVASAYNPGQRTYHVLGNILNSDKHPVHLIVQQKIDMKDILAREGYDALSPADKVRLSRTEYNEADGIYAQRITVTNLDGKIISDTASFVKDGYWYTIDYVKKTYDRLPELPGMQHKPFAESLISWFAARPEAGMDELTGYDYDRMTKGTQQLYFYYGKDSEVWKGYKFTALPFFEVVEIGDVVDKAAAFALPPENFVQWANPFMRARANSLSGKK